MNHNNFIDVIIPVAGKGERFYPQEKFKPTIKELSISEFKEKYGSDRYPKAFFRIEV